MRNALIFFGTLRDSDVAWLVGAGRRVPLDAGGRLVQEGVALDSIYLILDGKFSVTVHGMAVAALAPGEMIGETSFLDGGLPSATVTATVPSHVLAIERKRLAARLDRDEGFASRIYRSLAVTVADRLRTSNLRAAGGAKAAASDDGDSMDEIPMDVLERSTIAAGHFTEILRRTGGA